MGAQKEITNGANVPEVVKSAASLWHLSSTPLESLLTAAQTWDLRLR